MWIDISVPLGADAPAWPGDTPYSARWTWSLKTGGSVNVSAITLSPHVATHADAPFHVRLDGAKSERLPLAAFLGRCTVVDVRGNGGELQVASLGAAARGNVERVLLKTGHGVAGGTFPDAWPWLALDAVRDLLRRGLRLLGVDAPSIDARESKTLDVHHALFAGGAYNLENLDLRYVAAGSYELFAAPLAVAGIDAAPVRALLRPLS
ncbi:MAG TPA: cyclase family protein [Gemmatimonadaceae bacterium]|nr:cyclase family protein [Gemmatimonadaceae bacterium]